MRSGRLIGGVALLACALGCTPEPVDIRFRIEAIQACRGETVGPIRCVLVRLVRFDELAQCRAGEQLVVLPQEVSRIDLVQNELSKERVLFDVVAARTYEIQAIGYKSRECTPELDLSFPFCGYSEAARFDVSSPEPLRVPAYCEVQTELIQECRSRNLALRPCL
jgi:hypothetical protein